MTQTSARASLDAMDKSPVGVDVRKGLEHGVKFDANGDLAEAVDAVIQKITALGIPIWQRGGTLVRVVNKDDTQPSCKGIRRDPIAPRIVAHDHTSLADTLTSHLSFWRMNRKGEREPVDCPPIIAKSLLARCDWPGVPHLYSVVEHPVVLPDGRLLDQSGYDAATGLLLVLPRSTFISVDHELDMRDCAVALEKLRYLLSGFAFESDLDFSAALALMSTPFVRPVVPTAPLFGVTSPAPGSGKSEMVRAIAMLSTGRGPAFMVAPADPAELEKVLFAAVLEGSELIAIDNVETPVTGAVLAVLATSSTYSGRLLGASKVVAIPLHSVVALNGNNLAIRGDLTRRTLMVALDPRCERPAERDFEFDLLQEIEACRAEYVHAVLVIICAYLRSGTHLDLQPFGSFDLWSRMVREPLVWLGLPDPVESIRAQESVDPEREALRVMLDAVTTLFGQREFKAADLIAAARPIARSDDRERLAEALEVVCERNGELNAKALGRWLSRMHGRYEGSSKFVRVRQTKDFSCWKVAS